MVPQRGQGARSNGAPQELQNLDSAGLTCAQIGHSDRNVEICANPEGDFSIITHTPGSMAGCTSGRALPRLLDDPLVELRRSLTNKEYPELDVPSVAKSTLQVASHPMAG
jgi:hypothetical protein